jgi:hypothetical protein
MTAQSPDYADRVEKLLSKARKRLDSPNPRDWVSAVHYLALGVANIERQVLLDARASAMTWAEIGNVYGVSRQAVHRRFADETVLASTDFDALLDDLEDPGAEAIPSLAQAGKRLRHAAESQ